MDRTVSAKQRALFMTASVLAVLAAVLAVVSGVRSVIGVTQFIGMVSLTVVAACFTRQKTKAAMMLLPLTFYFVPSVWSEFLENGRGILFGIFVPQYWSIHWQEILFSFWLPALLYAIILMTVLLVIPTRIPAMVLLGAGMAAPLAYDIFVVPGGQWPPCYQLSGILFLAAVLLTVLALPVKKRQPVADMDEGKQENDDSVERRM